MKLNYYLRYLLCLSLLILCTGCAGIAHAEEVSEQFADAPAEMDFLNPGNLQEIPADPEPEPETLQDLEPEFQEDSEIPETVPVNPLRERVNPENSEIHLIDENQVLSESVRETYENLLAQKNICLLITNHLDGLPPGEFAKNYHEALLAYSENSDSIFILINNDTYQDAFHVSGAYATEFYAEQLRMAILQATPALVEGRYEDALEIFCN
ncbi:MAG: TPM domain-containing protein [Oscillospiraceae bacterium]|nr:TPM domain-containing protein [Oscillospiraceae bacterium]